jgi:hypothetical protein
MMKFLALAGSAAAIAASAQAMPRTIFPAGSQTNPFLSQIREGCGAGRLMLNGHCVTWHAIRAERRAYPNTGGYYGNGATFGGAIWGAPGYTLGAGTPHYNGGATCYHARDASGRIVRVCP